MTSSEVYYSTLIGNGSLMLHFVVSGNEKRPGTLVIEECCPVKDIVYQRLGFYRKDFHKFLRAVIKAADVLGVPLPTKVERIIAAGSGRPWNVHEDALLRRIFACQSQEAWKLARVFDRMEADIRSRVKELGLTP